MRGLTGRVADMVTSQLLSAMIELTLIQYHGHSNNKLVKISSEND